MIDIGHIYSIVYVDWLYEMFHFGMGIKITCVHNIIFGAWVTISNHKAIPLASVYKSWILNVFDLIYQHYITIKIKTLIPFFIMNSHLIKSLIWQHLPCWVDVLSYWANGVLSQIGGENYMPRKYLLNEDGDKQDGGG